MKSAKDDIIKKSWKPGQYSAAGELVHEKLSQNFAAKKRESQNCSR